MSTNIYYSYAKINLGLLILNKRDDGYHNIRSIFIELNLADELIFQPSSKLVLTAENNNIKLPLDENNLIIQAYRLIRSKTKTVQNEYTIHIRKHIPIFAGLGGGSSNAAITLSVLNKLWNLNIPKADLEIMSADIGSDIPFFIEGGCQLVKGIGDQLITLNTKCLKGLYFLLVVPPISISTEWAYKKLNKSLHPKGRRHKFPPISDSMNWQLFENDFERVIGKTYPEICTIKAKLYKAGSLFAGLSGSGSTVFGVFDNLKKAKLSLGIFPQYQTFLSTPVYR